MPFPKRGFPLINCLKNILSCRQYTGFSLSKIGIFAHIEGSLAEIILFLFFAYSKGMKVQGIFAACVAVVIAFLGAVGLCIHALSLPQTVSAQPTFRVVLDAGHGGIDGGVVGVKTGAKESDLNLSITLMLRDRLSALGCEVTLTRRTQDGLYGTTAAGFKKRDMLKRKEIAEAAMPQFVVSIHQNFFPSHAQRGAQVFYNAADEQSKRLAEGLQTGLNELYAAHGVKNRSAMAGDYFMLRLCVPSVIVECGFLSSEADEALLCSSDFQRRICARITSAVLEAFSLSTG